MELYIPPPTAFLPRLPPPRPVVPAVPIVPPPDLPEILHAPEGTYTLSPSPTLFPTIGTPSAPITYDGRLSTPPTAFIGGAGGFIMAPGPPPQTSAQQGQTAMSFGSTIVNGQTQPAWPVKMSWVTVFFPQKQVVGDKGFLGMGGGGGGGGGAGKPEQTQGQPQYNQNYGYEPSVSSDSDPSSSDAQPVIPLEIPLSALPQVSQGKRIPFMKAPPPNALPRPKNNLRSSNSTFVTRMQALDNLPKIIAERGRGGGEFVRWGFWNLGRTLGWGEEGGRVKEPFARVTFSQVPTCHTVSHITAGPDRLDIIVGFASGDIVWLDFTIGRYTRINKGGLLNNTPVTSVHFHPREPQHFLATFQDSTLLQFNIFAEDPSAPHVTSSPMPWITQFESTQAKRAPFKPSSHTVTRRGSVDAESGAGGGGGGEVYEDGLMVWGNAEFGNLGDLPAGNGKKKGVEERSPWAGRNPVKAARVGDKVLTAVAYSPDGKWLSAVSDDGMMRLVDIQEERLSDTFAGYFGTLNCVAWSPDSRFLAVGGQDDLITLFSARESRVVARCQGHTAFVTAISFDSTRSGGYRFGSVGEDGKLVLWDFTAASLHRPRHHQQHANSSSHRLAGSTVSLNGQSRSHLPLGANPVGGRYHPAPSRSEVALLQPVMARVVEGNLLTGIHFTGQAIVTISRAAIVKFWQRPPRQSAQAGRQRRTSSKDLKSGRERDRERERGEQREREAIMA